MIPDFVRGCIAPVFTAFDADGRLDDEGQRAILDYIVETRAVSACFVRSGLGQMYTFSYDDARQIAKTACAHLAGKVPVLVGATGPWDRNPERRPEPAAFLQQALELSRYAQDVGAAAVVHTMPEAIEPKQGQTHADVILDYFEQVCAAVSVPVFIYQPPGTDPDYRVTPALVTRLADMPKIAGMKMSTNDAEYIFNICWTLRGKDFGFISGAETAFLAGLVCGSRAVIGQGATLNPQILKAIQDRFERGDLEGACAAQWSTNLLVTECGNSPEFLKRYLAEKGRKVQPFSRQATGPYMASKPTWTPERYAAYKQLFESELAKFA